MAEVSLTLSTLAGGEVAADIEKDLQKIAESFDEKDLLGDRTLTVKIVFTKEDDRFVRTKATVSTSIPSRTRQAMAWRRDSTFKVESTAPDGRQIDLVKAIEEKNRKGGEG